MLHNLRRSHTYNRTTEQKAYKNNTRFKRIRINMYSIRTSTLDNDYVHLCLAVILHFKLKVVIIKFQKDLPGKFILIKVKNYVVLTNK